MSDITGYFSSETFTDKGKPDGLGQLNFRYASEYIDELPTTIFNLYLGKKPDTGTLHQLKVMISFSDGSSTSQSTPLLRLR